MSTVEEQLAWEAEQRPRASAAAIAAGVLGLAANVLLQVLFRGGPGTEDGFVSSTEALDARLEGRPVGEESLFTRQAEYYGDNVVPFVLVTLLGTLSVILAGLTLAYLYRATVARAEGLGRLPIVMVVIGTVSYAVGHTVRDLSTWIGSAGLGAGVGAREARDVLGSGLVLGGSLFELIGLFALGVGFALIALNAMRAGLLTRFLGILGVIVGILAVFQIDQPQIIRTFWLVAVGWMIIAGRGKGGLLPAWHTGRAEPWPTQQEIREQREAVRGGSKPDAPQPAPGGAVSSAEQARRKRKKRR